MSDLCWWDGDKKLSAKESLRAACAFRNSHIARRWWDAMSAKLDSMSNQECEDALKEIKRMIDDSVAEYRRFN